MNSFDSEQIHKLVSHQTLRTVRMLGEYKGRQELYIQQTPQILDALRQAAVVQSTESSNRIEGVVASFSRIQELVAEKTTPRDRSEQEIAGYRDVLQTIHSSYEHIPLTPGVVQQFHGDLYRYSAATGGKWKNSDNEIVTHLPDGRRIVRFRPVEAWATPMAMDELHYCFNQEWQAEQIDPLLLTAAYILDFLCIHPFLDGNGRMARLLTLLLLYKSGYEVGRYISLEKIVEDTKESYYEALGRSSHGWHEGKHDLEPWSSYLLGILLAAHRDFEKRVGTLSSARGAKTQMVMEAFERLPGQFRLVDLERACPNVTRDMIRVVLNRLKGEGRVEAVGRGAGAAWVKRSRELAP
jgi:Fic family protein